jgi:hypothetical protein
MKLQWLAKHKLVAGMLAAVVLGGAAGGAVAATQSSSSNRQAYLDDVAHRLGVSAGALSGAMQAAAIDRIEAELAAGRITKSQADTLEQRVKEGHVPLFGSAGLAGHRLRNGLGRAGASRDASRYLGISPETLRLDLRSGKSLAQIVGSTRGKSVAGLKAAILAEVKKRLDAGVSRGRLSSKRESETLTRLASRVEGLLAARSSALHG